MKNKNYFYGTKATNADVVRHREKEQELRNKFAQAQANGDDRSARVYQNLLNLLLASKAEVVAKLGKKG